VIENAVRDDMLELVEQNTGRVVNELFDSRGIEAQVVRVNANIDEYNSVTITGITVRSEKQAAVRKILSDELGEDVAVEFAKE
jgi:hypothetical protein